jgi:hypothetical protein
MWDFDNTPLSLIKVDLTSLQQQHNLPNIYILNTGKPNHYIAYCFKRCQWWNAKRIIAQSLFTCEDYFKWGIFRKRFTLRVTPKEGRKPKLVALLYSKTKEDVKVSELTSWVKDEKSTEQVMHVQPVLPSLSPSQKNGRPSTI